MKAHGKVLSGLALVAFALSGCWAAYVQPPDSGGSAASAKSHPLSTTAVSGQTPPDTLWCSYQASQFPDGHVSPRIRRSNSFVIKDPWRVSATEYKLTEAQPDNDYASRWDTVIARGTLVITIKGFDKDGNLKTTIPGQCERR